MSTTATVVPSSSQASSLTSSLTSSATASQSSSQHHADHHPYFVYITASTVEEAKMIGAALVHERLAACANITSGMESIYWWQDRVETAAEAVLVVKTVHVRLATLIARTKELHSYDIPCVVALPVAAGNPDYLAWIADAVLLPSSIVTPLKAVQS
jgi:periplasmic divalent cation tolerance protein